ncbi:cytochrome c biogenesis protein transmembrane region [Hymenobacter roseosalivarius DSM 11622]|uniref:Cytochrome c biogenesis protein transmembrane region n=1 Tax=Hymenobacter roseosalivarius DSM 11622 TaxID=645990 RepID=A0A1W1VUJ5_9BACT|nr:protein-disulfide reductase DsbD [Hymenobacter roseosalivarius]SMB96890.1 cytochrome c biogenesis protein transmembrane region [Hymenobacter roseosalivarius DSM 11622]
MLPSRILLSLFLLVLTGASSMAQVLTPTKLSAAISQPTAKVGDEIELIVNARMSDTWHLYATDFDPDLGPTVFAFTFPKSAAYTIVGKPKSVGAKKKYDEVFGGDITYFEKTGQIRQRIKVLQPGPLTIKAEVEYQTCTDVDGRCIPGDETLSFGPINVAAAPAGTGAVAPPARLPSATSSASAAPNGGGKTAVRPALASAENVEVAADLAPTPPATAAQAAVVAPAASVTTATVGSASAAAGASGTGSLWGFGVLAFFSGLAALITPCVFPMVPMTVSFFTGGTDSRARGILKALVYGLSIILIYTIIGVIVARLLGEDGPNFMATHWLPNLLFFAVFVVFGLSFLGLFEITLPNALVNKADAQADKGGWLGVFFMAFTLVLVSFSCTGPIVATVLGLAARGETIMPVVGMFGFSLAFALPFTLFAVFPSWLKSLPRSGGWLNTVKVVLGFVELMLALKFLSMADLAYHWDLLNRDVYLVLWIVLSALLGLYLLGKFKLSHDSEITHLSVPRLLLAILAFSFMTYLVPGLFGAPLPLLAGYLPPQSTRDFTLAAPGGNSAAPPATAANELCETPRYADFLELPHGLSGFFDLEQAKRCAIAQQKPVFIDFTGHACVNCRKMEATVWSDPQVLKRLREDYVIVALYVDDKKELPQNEWYTSRRDNKKKSTLGKQNADFQIVEYGVNAQPYYVLLNAEAGNQPLVPPIAYEPDVAGFLKFLDAGLAQYRRQTQPMAAR